MPNHKPKTLIIDDDTFLLDLYAMKFKESGLDVTAVRGGRDALDKLREGLRPDVILLDMVMPEMSGVEFLETMRKENLAAGVPVVVLTNQSDAAEQRKAEKLGISEYVFKMQVVPSEVVKVVIRHVKSA